MSRPRKKKGRPVSGWVILDKPVGMGSTEAVSKVKWLFQAEKAGHAGTLDPLASGMLPIALGEATKTVPYVQDGAKIYRFTVAWGEERSTDGKIAINEDTTTPVFSPYSGRVSRLIARPGDFVERGFIQHWHGLAFHPWMRQLKTSIASRFSILPHTVGVFSGHKRPGCLAHTHAHICGPALAPAAVRFPARPRQWPPNPAARSSAFPRSDCYRH